MNNINMLIEEFSNKLKLKKVDLSKYSFKKIDESGYKIEKHDDKVFISYSKDVYLFTAFFESLTTNKKTILKNPKFNNFGIMLDAARNAVPKLETLKHYILVMASLGYDYLEIYVEDVLTVLDEPNYGYMRGRYTEEEIKALDQYASNYGIELVPCIQTLAHLDQIFRHQEYAEINDIDDILVVGEDRTYKLIENIIKTTSTLMKSRQINIGMDEAWKLGVGKYLAKNGYETRSEIMFKHLAKVLEICNKYGYKPAMWADMFFQMTGTNYHQGTIEFSQEIIDRVPKNVELIYWDYYKLTVEEFDQKFKEIKSLSSNFSYAGGAWKWVGFAPHNAFTLRVMELAMQSAIKNEAKKVLITAWGDNGGESSHFSILPSLIYLSQRNLNDEISDRTLNKTSKALTNYSFTELMDLDLVNILYDEKIHDIKNPSKYLLYEDALMGEPYQTPKLEFKTRYLNHYDKLKKIGNRNSNYNYMFKNLAELANVLSIKSTLSVEIYNAYHEKNNLKLKELHDLIPDLIKRIDKFIASFTNQWYIENKTFGFEIQSYRLGGLKQRLKEVKELLSLYINNKINVIEQLEERKLVDNNKPYNGTLFHNYFNVYISPSKI